MSLSTPPPPPPPYIYTVSVYYRCALTLVHTYTPILPVLTKIGMFLDSVLMQADGPCKS